MWRNVSVWHLLVIVLALVLLFGWKRLPDMARSLGRSMRIFKSEVEQMTDKGKDRDGEHRSAASRDTVSGTSTRDGSASAGPATAGEPAREPQRVRDDEQHRA